MAADLDSLITSEIPEGRQNLLDSHTNLGRVAEYCENNYFQCENKRAALEETKGYTTQSLASVAYQINTLAYNFLQMLDLQASQIQEMESQINHISQTVAIHKEKVARREIGVLTTNKCSNRLYKIIAPANPERPIKYVRKPIDYGALDHIGHGVKSPQKDLPRQMVKRPSTASQYGPGNQYGGGGGGGQYGPGGLKAVGQQYQGGSLGNVSQNSSSGAGPAPTTKPPTPPQNKFPSGTLNRSKDYRTPPVVAPPQVPSNYAPNYPKGARGQQYGTLPHHHPQVGMVYPQPQEGSATTMPRLSSNSMRSANHSNTPTPPPQQEPYGITRKPSSSSDMDPHEMYGGMMRQTSQTSTGSRTSSSQYMAGGQYGSMLQQQQRGNTPPSQYGRGATPPSQQQYGSSGSMARPTQRPPSPPLNPPLVLQQGYAAGRGEQQVLGRQDSSSSVYSSRAQMMMMMGQSDTTYSSRMQLQQQQQQPHMAPAYGRQLSAGSLMSDGAGGQLMGGGPPAPPPAGPPMGNGSGGYPTAAAGPVASSGIVVRDASLPGWVPKNYLEKVSAIYDYNADKEDELTFQEGQTIYVLKKNDDGWWEGVMDGITGLFPGNYVEQTV